jgi:uncharacterized protein with GYD domain
VAKYLARASYTAEGLKGLFKEGSVSRREAVAKDAKSFGGTLEAYYYAFGDTDLCCIVDYPDNVTATAAALIVNAAGTAKCKTVVLITPEEVDQATDLAKEKMAAYRPPGKE